MSCQQAAERGRTSESDADSETSRVSVAARSRERGDVARLSCVPNVVVYITVVTSEEEDLDKGGHTVISIARHSGHRSFLSTRET